GGEFDAVEGGGLLGVDDRRGDLPLVGLGGEDLRVVGDEVGLNPGSAAGVGGEGEELRLGLVEERFRFGHGRRLAGGLLSLHGEAAGGQDKRPRQKKTLEFHASLLYLQAGDSNGSVKSTPGGRGTPLPCDTEKPGRG